MNVRWVSLAGLLCLVTACTGPGTGATTTSRTTGANSESPSAAESSTKALGWDEVFRQVGPGVVRISALTCDDGGWTGSGFALSESIVVTAAHVASGARALTVQTDDGVTLAAEPVGIVPDSDVAILRLSQNLDVRPLGLAKSVPERGSELAVLGYPLGTFDLRIVNGIVAGVPEPVDYPDQHVDEAFITNAATNGGNSGGPVVDRTGEVIGLLSGGQNWDDNSEPVEGVNFVVPVDDVRDAVDNWADKTESQAEPCQDEQGTPDDGDTSSDDLQLNVQDTSDLGYAIAQILYTHGVAINDGAYEAAFELFTPAAQRKLGGLDKWSSGVEASYWRGIDVMQTSLNDDGNRATARVALRTEQPASGDVTECSIWILDYQLAITHGQLLIDKALGDRPTAC